MRQKLTRKTIHLPEGATNISAYATLEVLFREVLEEMPEAQAVGLSEAYREGKSIGVTLRENSRGVAYKTAFRWEIFVIPDPPKLDDTLAQAFQDYKKGPVN